MVGSEMVKLNVGGVKYLTTRSTLCSKGDNFFTALLNGKIPSTKYEEYYFIDRDGKSFHFVLEFLRTGQFEIPKYISEQSVLREVSYYGIHLSNYVSDVYLRDIQYSQIKEITEIKEIVFRDWLEAANKGQILRSRIFAYEVDSLCKLLENEFELSNNAASDYATRKKQFHELLPEVIHKYESKISNGELIGNTKCVTWLNKEENRVILMDHFKTFHPNVTLNITQPRAYRVTYKSYTNMDFNGWQFSNVLKD